MIQASPTHCLLLRAIEAGVLLDSIKFCLASNRYILHIIIWLAIFPQKCIMRTKNSNSRQIY